MDEMQLLGEDRVVLMLWEHEIREAAGALRALGELLLREAQGEAVPPEHKAECLARVYHDCLAALGGADQAEVLVVGHETESMRRRRLETAAVHRAH